MISRIHPQLHRRILRSVTPAAFLLVLPACLLLTGCPIAGIIADKLAVTKNDAQFKPKQVPLAVLVESYQKQAANESLGDELAIDIAELIKTNKVAPVIPADKLIELRTEHPESYGQMNIQSIGRTLGAGQVLYVDLKQVDVVSQPGSDVYTGIVDVRVKVVDVATGQTVWPTGTNDGYAIHNDSPIVLKSEVPSESAVRSQLLADMSQEITKLFYDYTPDNNDQPTGVGK